MEIDYKESKNANSITRKVRGFVRYNIMKAFHASKGPIEQDDLVSKLVAMDGYLMHFKGIDEYRTIIIQEMIRLTYERDWASVKIVDDKLRYGIVPKNRPYKESEKK